MNQHQQIKSEHGQRIYDLNSSEAQVLLSRARQPSDAPEEFWVPFAARTRVQGTKAVFQRVDGAVPVPGLLTRWFSSFRAISLTATVVPGFAVLAATAGTQSISMTIIVATLLAVMMTQLGVNIFNDYEDHKRLVDLPEVIGGSGVIQKGWIRPHHLNLAAWFLLMGGIALGAAVLLGLGVNPWWLLLGVFLGSLGYSNRPFNFKYVALGDLIVFVLCGPLLTFGFSLAFSRSWGIEGSLLGIIFGLLAVGILHANNTNDINTDKKSGALTLAGVIGFNRSKDYFDLIYVSAVLAMAALAWVTQYVLVFIAILPMLGLWLRMRKKLRSASSPESASLATIRFEAAQTHLLSGVILSVVLGLSRI